MILRRSIETKLLRCLSKINLFRFVQLYEAELNKIQMICHYCGCFSDEKTINSPCHKNAADVMKDLKGNFTDATVPPENINNKRHYFARPKAVYINLI